MNSLKEILKKNGFALFLTLIYAFLTGFAALYHEPWRDEAQAWLIARDLSLSGVFQQMPYNGTPGLWHMLLFPFAKLGFPYWTASVIHLVIAVSAVYLFLAHAPFSKVTKILFIFSYYMAYEYAIIIRNYNIAIAILFLIAVLYYQRLSRPLRHAFLVFLLANTNVLGFIMALSLSAIFLAEFLIKKCKTRLASVAFGIMFLGCVIALKQMLPAADSIHYHFLGAGHQERFWLSFRDAFLPGKLTRMVPEGVSIVVVLCLLGMAVVSFSTRPAVLFFMISCYTGLFYLFSHLATRPISTRHHGFVLIILIFCLWVGARDADTDRVPFRNKLIGSFLSLRLGALVFLLLNLCLLFSVTYAFQMYYQEIRRPFSNAKEMARFISRSHLENEIIVAYQSPQASAILPYLPHTKFWYADIRDRGTFVIFNKRHEQGIRISNAEVILRAKAAFPHENNIFYLLSAPLENPQALGLKLVYEAHKMGCQEAIETYYLYR
jgi:hypothetical protein